MPWTIRNAISSPYARRVIVGLHVLFLVALYFHQGIHSDKEALKYLGCAGDILQGDFTDLFGTYLKYSGYVLFLVPFVAIGVPPLAVLVQMILGILAALALANMVERASGSKVSGTIAMALLLFCYPVQVWTLALYTESFFTSMTLLFLDRATRRDVPTYAIILLGVITILSRPVGMLFVGPVMIHKFFYRFRTIAFWHLRWPIYVLLLLVAINIPGIPRPQLEPIVDAHVIAGVTEGPGAMDGFSGSSIISAQRSLLDRLTFQEWIGLMGRRAFSLLNPFRSYYSRTHNLLAGTVILLYPFALLGIFRWCRDEVGELLLVPLMLNIALVGLTHDEWSGRFLAPLLPLVIALAVMGAVRKTGS